MSDVGEYRGANKVSTVADALAAGRKERALVLANSDVVEDDLHLLFGDHRAERRGAIAGIADPERFRARRQPLDHLVVNPLLDEHARARRADLTRVEENARRRGLGGGIEIGVVKDDVGGLAAELKRYALEIARGALHDSTADAGRSGEGDLVDVGVIDEGLAHDPPGACDDIQHARRQSRLERKFADAQRRQRRQLGRLHDNGAAARQGRRELPHPDHQREIPGHDGRHHADRLAHRVGQRVVARGHDLAADLVGPAGVIGQRVYRRREILAKHGRDRLAGVKAFQPSDFVRVLFQKVRPSEQNMTALCGTHRAPRTFEGTARGSHRTINVGFDAIRDRGDDLFGRGIEGFEGAPGGGRNVPAVDQQQLFLGGRNDGRCVAGIIICNRHHISSGSWH